MNSKQYDNLMELIPEVMDRLVTETTATVLKDVGGPFGAAILKWVETEQEYRIVSMGTNTVISSDDPTNHAEMNAIRLACNLLGTFDLTGCVLVTTGQSCPMCLSAAIWANISHIYYGTTYEDAEELGFRDSHIFDYINGKNFAVIENEICRDKALKLHEVWKQKQDKVNY